MIFTTEKGQSIALSDIVGHIANTANKKKRCFFALSQKACEQLDAIARDLNGSRKSSQSNVVEQAIHTYYTLYKYVEKIIE